MEGQGPPSGRRGCYRALGTGLTRATLSAAALGLSPEFPGKPVTVWLFITQATFGKRWSWLWGLNMGDLEQQNALGTRGREMGKQRLRAGERPAG